MRKFLNDPELYTAMKEHSDDWTRVSPSNFTTISLFIDHNTHFLLTNFVKAIGLLFLLTNF